MINANTESFSTMELFERVVLFADGRIDPETVPDGLYKYSFRHGDDWSMPCSLEEKVVVNHWGDILTDKPFILPFGEKSSYLSVTEEDWGFLEEEMTAAEFLASR